MSDRLAELKRRRLALLRELIQLDEQVERAEYDEMTPTERRKLIRAV